MAGKGVGDPGCGDPFSVSHGERQPLDADATERCESRCHERAGHKIELEVAPEKLVSTHFWPPAQATALTIFVGYFRAVAEICGTTVAEVCVVAQLPVGGPFGGYGGTAPFES
jgi:hypothetical protein